MKWYANLSGDLGGSKMKNKANKVEEHSRPPWTQLA